MHLSSPQVQEWILDAGISVFLLFSEDHDPQQRWVGDKFQSVLWFRSEYSEGLLFVLGYQLPVMIHDLLDFRSIILTLPFEGQDAPGPPVVQVLRRVVRPGTREVPVALLVLLPQPGIGE
ncbi:hypothetical protein HispidOSU_001146 [Sigmodon hispidus]